MHDKDVNEESIAHCSNNYLKVRIGNTIDIYGLASDEFSVVNHISSADQLEDPENHVVTGLDTHYVTNHSGSHYIITAPGGGNLIYGPKTKFVGVFRTFS